jgi:cytochrome c oxidase subunit 2
MATPMSSTPRRRLAPEAVIAAVVVILLAILVPVVVYSRVGETLFPPAAATSQAVETRRLYDIVFALAVAIFIAVEGLIVWSVIRYRRKPTDVDLPPQTHGNNLVEIIWTIIPTVIVLYLFAISYSALNTVDAVSATPDIRIHAVAEQFVWHFEYLDANGKRIAVQTEPRQAKGGGMGLPVGKNVVITLDSPDVIHAFYVPKFLFKRDVVPGQTNTFQVNVDASEAKDGQPAIFGGQCAELCGTGHRTMLFDVVAMTPGDYEAWLQALIAKNNATPPPAPSGAASTTIVAKNTAYDQTAIEVQAGQPFVIDFKNEDIVIHDVDIRKDDKTTVVEDQPYTEAGKETNYTYKPLEPGTYVFICSVHPTQMSGTLTVH